MKPNYFLISRVFFLVLFCFLTVSPTVASEYDKIITESYVKNEFVFQDAERFKYSKCRKNSYPTCKYVWGVESKKDTTRVKMGLPPDGNSLTIVYAQAKQEKNFSRVVGSYSDAVDIDGLGVKAIWSDKRRQLSMITKSHLIIHIRLEVKGVINLKDKAMNVALHILSQV